MKKICLFLFISMLVAQNPLFAQTSIYDLQFVDVNSGSDVSNFNNQIVTVKGIVTASMEADNLGKVFIQQSGKTEWSGIELVNDPELMNLKVGDKIKVTGKVIEEDLLTKITEIDSVRVIASDSISKIIPVIVNPNIFTNYNLFQNEKYEGMLVTLKSSPRNIEVVDVNPTTPINYGQWIVGSVRGIPDGCRVLTGRQTEDITSSLNVFFVNDSIWTIQDGEMRVPPFIIEKFYKFASITGLMSSTQETIGEIIILPRNNDDVIPEVPLSIARNSISIRNIQLVPNPVRNHAELRFSLNQAMSIQIELVDLQGRLIRELLNVNQLSAGQHVQKISIDPDLPSGNYFLKMGDKNGNSLIPFYKN